MKKKPLCWEGRSGSLVASAARTRLGGHYIVTPIDTGFVVMRVFPTGNFATLQHAPTLAAAQATAQADYETR
jgi:hypothetical protein